jgi:hypothetical protein
MAGNPSAAFDDTEVLCDDCKHPLYEPASRALGLGPVCRRGQRDLTPPSHGQLSFDLTMPDSTPEV